MAYSLYPAVWAARLASTDKLVLMKLADHADEAGEHIYPAVPTIAKACALGVRTVQDSLKRLRAAGLIEETREADFGARRPTEYRINLDTLTGAAAAPVHMPHRCNSRTLPPQQPRGTGAAAAPKSSLEPSIEPEEEEGGAFAPPAAYRWEGSVIRMSEVDYQKLRTSFPKVEDFDGELSTADAWLVDNPEKAKGWWLFLNRWLKRANANQAQRRPSLGDAFVHARSLRGI